jgi:acetoacetate decarboxylase
MTENDVTKQAFAMPLSSPAYPCGPYRYLNREYLIVTYRTDPDKLAAVIPAPLEMIEPVVSFEFIRMPDSTGFGDYTESGQVIPVSFRGERGGYVHAMYLNDFAPIAGGRELWGFPKKLASPELRVDKDTIGGVLRYGAVPVALVTMGYKHRTLPNDQALAALATPGYLLKIIPHVDGSARICELVRYVCKDITVKGAWEGPASLDLLHHALAPVAALPVREIISGVHILSDLTLGLGTVVYDYLETRKEPS